MALTLNPIAQVGIHMGTELSGLVAALRAITVRILGPGPACGSGVLWVRGLVVTNAHVARASTHQLELADGTVMMAQLLARDERQDLALLLAPGAIMRAEIRDSATLRAGELVVAVGNPVSDAGALTAGIVHQAPRSCIVTDLRLAPGNSGGPLADVKGRVLGINTMVVNGFGVAIPSATVQRFIREVRPEAA